MNPTIEIQDEVNVRIRGVNEELLKEAQAILTYYVPNYRYMEAVRMGRWDGKIRLMTATGKTFLNLLDDVLPVFESAGINFDIDDQRRSYDNIIGDIESRGLPQADYFSEYELKGEPIVLRDYQVAAVHAAIKAGQGVLEKATGSGKTLTTAVLGHFYLTYGNVIVIVPSIDLAVQTQSLYRTVGIDSGLWYGEVKDRRELTVSTWQSLNNYEELFSDVKCVIVDEVHEAKAKTLGEILSGPGANVPFRFGCSGTLPKEILFQQQIRGIIGPSIFQLRAWELQEQGVLAQSKVYQVVLRDSKNPVYEDLCEEYWSQLDPSERGTFKPGKINPFDDWDSQKKWSYRQNDRMEYIANLIEVITEDDGNSLVLVPNRDPGKALEALIEGADSLDGRDKGERRKAKYDALNEVDNGVLICTIGIASTGIDIPRIFNLFVIDPGKKFEKVIQMIGRGLRKAHDKVRVNIYDISGDVGFSKKHAADRRKLYKEARQEYEIIEVEYHEIS